MASFAARSALRSAATTARSSTVRLSAGAKPKASSSPFGMSSQKPLTARIFSSPVEMSSMVSMLPFHTATASAVLTSMLSVFPRTQGCSLGDMLIK